MTLRIRLASPMGDREQLLNLYKRNFTHIDGYFAERFDWHSRLNPVGEGWTWILYEQRTGRCVGATSLFPRQVYVDERQLKVGQVMLFAVDASYRSLGPAVQLQRATFQPVDSGQLDFCYDCPPHDEGMSTFARLGMRANCEVTRFVLPLRSDEYLGKRLGAGAWAKPVIGTANLLLRIRRSRRDLHGLEMAEFDGAFGDEFSELDKAAPTSGLIRGRRSADILNWLYRNRQVPPKRLPNGELEKARVIVARRGGELQGFVAYAAQTDNLVGIGDLFGTDLTHVGRPLLDAVIEFARRNRAYAVYAYSTPGSELSRLLQSAGFRPRERAARVVAYENFGGRSPRRLDNGLRWAFSQVELMA